MVYILEVFKQFKKKNVEGKNCVYFKKLVVLLDVSSIT